MHIRGAVIYVKQLDRMASFYEGALKLKPDSATRNEGWVEFAFGTTTFALHAIPAETASEIEILSPPKAREHTPIKLIFEVEDVDSECVRLESLGATVLSRPWGTHDVIDPEGNVFHIRLATEYNQRR
jgi:predicted enzyme related to lactoylglutathione lyase